MAAPAGMRLVMDRSKTAKIATGPGIYFLFPALICPAAVLAGFDMPLRAILSIYFLLLAFGVAGGMVQGRFLLSSHRQPPEAS